MIRSAPAPVRVWRDATPDQISKRFLNILLRDADLDFQLSRLFVLFATDPPLMVGSYSHHDGYRPLEPLNRRTT